MNKILYIMNRRHLFKNKTSYLNKMRFISLTAAGGHGLNLISHI